MQSVLVYGRLFARAVISGFSNNDLQPQLSWSPPHFSLTSRAQPTSVHLVTAESGIAKSPTSDILKKWSFGDDACFVARNSVGEVIGVADGVGGWRTYGIDPSIFPKTLMSTCERLVKEGHVRPSEPVGILARSYEEILQQKEPLIGSSTACLVALHREERKMYTANLGDSGFRVIRNGSIIHRSEEQQHYFNTPFQLAIAPTVLQGMVVSDRPELAESQTFGVQEGDIILVGTDGLFDNMNEDMILNHIRKIRNRKKENLQKVANSIANEAHQLAFDPDYLSPFALNAAANGFSVSGGKPDDITVMVACVTEDGTT